MRCPFAVKLALLKLISSTGCSEVITRSAGEEGIEFQLLAHCNIIKRGT